MKPANASADARPSIAVIVTVCGTLNHGHVILRKLLEGKEFADRVEPPRCDVVALHQLQVADDDDGAALAERYEVERYHSVAAALCRGGDKLAVDGVVIVAEQGDYPFNDRCQKLYPRREIFDQVVEVFRQSGRVVPVFIDKHLSWNWAWARHMWANAVEFGIPLMAGSSVVYDHFEPVVALPDDKPLDQVVVLGHGWFTIPAWCVLWRTCSSRVSRPCQSSGPCCRPGSCRH